MNNKEGFIVEGNKTLSGYIDKTITKTILDNITNELNEVLDNYITERPMYRDDFPIEFENDWGKWKLESDGTTQFQPKTPIQFIQVDCTISKTGEITHNKDNE